MIEITQGSPAKLCPECRGKRVIALLTSVASCTRCHGYGWVADEMAAKLYDPALGEPALPADDEYPRGGWSAAPGIPQPGDPLPAGAVRTITITLPDRETAMQFYLRLAHTRQLDFNGRSFRLGQGTAIILKGSTVKAVLSADTAEVVALFGL